MNDDIVHVTQNTIDSRINSVDSTLFIATGSQASNEESNGKAKLRDKLKVSNAEMVAFIRTQIRLLVNKFNARRSGYVLERRFTTFDEITRSKGHYAVQGNSRHRFWFQSKVHIYDFLY